MFSLNLVGVSSSDVLHVDRLNVVLIRLVVPGSATTTTPITNHLFQVIVIVLLEKRLQGQT